LIAAEVARGQAVVEHAGSIDDSLLANVAAAMTKKYSRKVTSVAQRNDALLAGLRVRVGDDVYESSVAGQLATFAAAV
jgi:F-type H+-transporting ATPase subunit delta